MAQLQEGQMAPAFTLPATSGGEVSLASLAGKVVVLYFYPKDDTPGCTLEAKTFCNLSPEFEAEGAAILGVSRDSIPSHEKFMAKHALSGLTLLADTDGSVCEAYGVIKEKNMYGKKVMGIERTTFVLDGDGRIAKIYPRVKVDGHAEAVLTFVRSLKG